MPTRFRVTFGSIRTATQRYWSGLEFHGSYRRHGPLPPALVCFAARAHKGRGSRRHFLLPRPCAVSDRNSCKKMTIGRSDERVSPKALTAGRGRPLVVVSF